MTQMPKDKLFYFFRHSFPYIKYSIEILFDINLAEAKRLFNFNISFFYWDMGITFKYGKVKIVYSTNSYQYKTVRESFFKTLLCKIKSKEVK